jgi:hypothetical protein
MISEGREGLSVMSPVIMRSMPLSRTSKSEIAACCLPGQLRMLVSGGAPPHDGECKGKGKFSLFSRPS